MNISNLNYCIFDLCIVAGDSYTEILENLSDSYREILLIYVGPDKAACEKYIYQLWDKGKDISLSTFEEPYSFFQSTLARNIWVYNYDLSEDVVAQLSTEVKIAGFPEDNIKQMQFLNECFTEECN